MRLIISRTDAIGDVCLTLPSIGWLKSLFPTWHICLLVKAYAAPIAQASIWVDEVAVLPENLTTAETSDWLKDLNADHIIHTFPNRTLAQASKIASIPRRSGVFGRTYHWLNCTDMVWLSRANSPHHEAFLNILLLSKILKVAAPSYATLLDNICLWGGLPQRNRNITLSNNEIILHPFSRGSGREWPISNFALLAHSLVERGYTPVIGGTAVDRQSFSTHDHLFPAETINVMGKDSLLEYIHRINSAAGLVASGTGPLHIATLVGCPSVGIFPPLRNIDQQRWGGIGPNSINLQINQPCNLKCSNTSCACMASINPQNVVQSLCTRTFHALNQ